jgi:regulator of cell morphogenesis and NO signaling
MVLQREGIMTIDVNTKTIGELAMEVPRAIAIMERWEIDYCCHSNRSVADACAAAGVTVTDLLGAIGEPRVPPAGGWETKTLAELQRYIVVTHHVYTRQTLETVTLLADKVLARHSRNHPEIQDVHRLVFELGRELFPHMRREEDVLFPYIETVEATGVRRVNTNRLETLMVQHETAGGILASLRKVTCGYKLPDDACLSFRALYERLADLESDLQEHIRLENEVLFPSAIRLEQRSAG